MLFDPALIVDVFPRVYKPAEDSYLLIRAVDGDFETALDMGTGTGIVALHAAKHGAVVTAVDNNYWAIANTRHNAFYNNINISIVKSDLFSKVSDSYDVIVFNPPYLPSINIREPWEGGRGGVSVMCRFLYQAINHINPGGCIYLVVSTCGDIPSLLKEFSSMYSFFEVAHQSFFFERLIVYAITPKNYVDNPKTIHIPKNRTIRAP